MMQVQELCLYGYNGEKRTVSFRLGSVNIITGKSKSGKSAVGDIIDYCMGGRDCNIAMGAVRDSVAWYGLLLSVESANVFVARKNPESGRQTSSNCYYEIGEGIGSPESVRFEPNANYKGIEVLLSRLAGISENVHVPNEGESRNPLEASIRHALLYCFQSQDEIAVRNVLFHRQGEPMMTNAIRDTLPYFLGAVDEDSIVLAAELRKKRRELKLLKARIEDAEALGASDVRKAVSLLAEASAVGLIDNADDIDKTNPVALYDVLSSVELRGRRDYGELEDKLESLQSKLQERRDELQEIRANIREAKAYMSDASGYVDELGSQRARLTSIGLFEQLNFDAGRCPLCSGRLDPEPPGVTMLKRSIERLDRSLGRVEREQPQLQRFVAEQEDLALAAKSEVTLIKAEIDGVYNQMRDAEELGDLYDRQAKVYGRISYWLENSRPMDDSLADEVEVEELARQIKEIEEDLDNESIRERTDSALSIIQNDMTRWAEDLEMEYAGSPYRLDLGKATAVADLARPIPLREMGGGSNWLGVHLISMFGLHKFFGTKGRPVPGFLFLDQPSQVYFPEGSTAEEDMDVRAVAKIYEFIRERVRESCGRLQVIVVDHARLDDAEFSADTIEDWRGKDDNLVPVGWLTALAEYDDGELG